MNGIICINKPSDYTSFDVIARLRGILKQRRIGHAGTLDPMATGVLPIFIGKATRACDMLYNQDKTYIAEFKLGLKTDTQDITGEVIAEKPVTVTAERVEEVILSFRGDIMQVPPMYSAIKINGQKLYDLARRGIEVQREARAVTIHDIKLLHTLKDHTYVIEVECSKGTYIRTLCHDIGEALGTYATLTKLERTKAAGFTLEQCFTIEDIENFVKQEVIEDHLIGVDSIFEHLPKIKLNEVQTSKFLNGVKLDLNRVIHDEEQDRFAVYSFEHKFLGTAVANKEIMELKIEKLFA